MVNSPWHRKSSENHSDVLGNASIMSLSEVQTWCTHAVLQLPRNQRNWGHVHLPQLPSESSHFKKLTSYFSSVKFCTGCIWHQTDYIKLFKDRIFNVHIGKTVWLILLGFDYNIFPLSGQHQSAWMVRLRWKSLLTCKWPFLMLHKIELFI